MASPIITTGDLLVTALNAVVWSPTFTAVRRYVVESNLKALDSLKVSVFGRNIEKEFGRGNIDNTFGLNIAFQQRIDAGSTTLCDPLLNLVDSVANWLLDSDRDRIGAAARTGLEVVLYNEQALRESSEFRSVILLTFNVEGSR